MAQDLETQEGSYWHAIVHRQEPDAGNSGYWFRQVGKHPIFPALRARAAEIGVEFGDAGIRWPSSTTAKRRESGRGRRRSERRWRSNGRSGSCSSIGAPKQLADLLRLAPRGAAICPQPPFRRPRAVRDSAESRLQPGLAAPLHFSSGVSVFMTSASTLRAPAALGCMPSRCMNSSCAPTPSSRKGISVTLVFRGQILVHRFEFLDERRAVVRRERHAGEHDARAAALKRLDHLREVGLRDRERNAAQSVVAAEFEKDDGRLFGERHGHAREAVLRGVAAHAEIDDAVLQGAPVQVLLEKVGKTLAGVETEAGGDAVAEADDGGARVGGSGRRGGRGARARAAIQPWARAPPACRNRTAAPPWRSNRI